MRRPAPFKASGLAAIRPQKLGRGLSRGIRLRTLFSKTPPEPLYASASPGRYNVRGIRCLYFGEDFVTAYSEALQEHAVTLIDHPTRERETSGGYDLAGAGEEPIVLFRVEASIGAVLDLMSADVRAELEVVESALLNPWRWQSSIGQLPVTQELGDATYRSGRFEAIRYPSEKSPDHAAWAIFVDRLRPPSFIEVMDVSGTLRGRLP